VCEGASERCLTNFKVYALHVARRLSYVDLVFILWIGHNSEDLGGKPDRVAAGVLRLGGLARRLVEGRTTRFQLCREGGQSWTYVVWK
jgi:hypothetical protein